MIAFGLFLIALAASLIAAFAGMGAIGGPDIGFAGAALWFVAIPAAAMGTLFAWGISSLATNPDRRAVRRTAFILLAPCFACALSAATAQLLKDAGKPEFIYIAGPGYSASLTVTAPSQVTVGEPLAIQVTHASGPWQRVRYKEARGWRTYSVEDPSKNEFVAASGVQWRTRPKTEIRAIGSRINGNTFEMTLAFDVPGTYELWGTMGDQNLPGATENWTPDSMGVNSNTLTITVLPRGSTE